MWLRSGLMHPGSPVGFPSSVIDRQSLAVAELGRKVTDRDAAVVCFGLGLIGTGAHQLFGWWAVVIVVGVVIVMLGLEGSKCPPSP